MGRMRRIWRYIKRIVGILMCVGDDDEYKFDYDREQHLEE